MKKKKKKEEDMIKKEDKKEEKKLQIISKQFSYISKNKNSGKYEIFQEYESSLFRFIKKNIL